MPEDQRKELGRVAFQAYSANRGGKNHDGSKTPEWEALPAEIQHAWAAAARAAVDFHKTESARAKASGKD